MRGSLKREALEGDLRGLCERDLLRRLEREREGCLERLEERLLERERRCSQSSVTL